MANEVSIYEPRTMGRVVRSLPPVHSFFRSTFFTHEETFDTKKVDIDFVKGNRKLAPFVHRVIGGKVVPNTGYETKSYTPPLLSPERVTTIDNILDRRPGESITEPRSPEERALEKMREDYSYLKDMTDRRIEWMCVQSIFKGYIPIIGDGLDEIIDFNFTNKKTITSAEAKWSSADSDPLYDLEEWHKEVRKNGFTNCDICVMASDVASAFLNHPTVQKLLDVKNIDLAAIKPEALANGAAYIGRINKLNLSIYTYDEWYTDDWTNSEIPAEKPMIPDGSLALLSSRANYSIYYGAVVLINEATKAFRTVEGKYVPDVRVERRPASRFLSLSSAPLTVPHNVDSWFVAEGLV